MAKAPMAVLIPLVLASLAQGQIHHEACSAGNGGSEAACDGALSDGASWLQMRKVEKSRGEDSIRGEVCVTSSHLNNDQADHWLRGHADQYAKVYLCTTPSTCVLKCDFKANRVSGVKVSFPGSCCDLGTLTDGASAKVETIDYDGVWSDDDHLGTVSVPLTSSTSGTYTMTNLGERNTAGGTIGVTTSVVRMSSEYAWVEGAYQVKDPVVYYPAKYVLPANAAAAGVPPPMVVANDENLDPKVAELGLDMRGIWWMSDNPVPEELVSMANTKVRLTNGSYPISLKVPNSRKGMWSWLTTRMGTFLRKKYATTDPNDPNSNVEFLFKSPSEGDIQTGVPGVKWFKFYKYTLDCDVTSGSKELCDPTDCAPKGYNGTCADLIRDYPNDMYSRPTKFITGGISTYTLKRVVMGDGSPHPVFWDEFMEHMTSDDKEECTWKGFRRTCTTTIPGVRGEKQMQSYMSDNWCDRKNAAWRMLIGC